jgi:hypothetical protein
MPEDPRQTETGDKVGRAVVNQEVVNVSLRWDTVVPRFRRMRMEGDGFCPINPTEIAKSIVVVDGRRRNMTVYFNVRSRWE